MADLFVTGKRYYYSRLPEHEKKIYMEIYNGLRSRRTKFIFPLEKYNGVYPPPSRLWDILYYVTGDNPDLYYVDGTNIVLKHQSGPRQYIHVNYTEYYSPEQSRQVEQILRMRVDELLSMLHDQAEGHPQVYKLYCHMLDHIRYDYDSVAPENSLSDLEAHTVVGPLLNHYGVCAGYTKMFKLICDQLGIGCFYIRGEAKGAQGWGLHSWNVVFLDGAFYHVDVTFDTAYYLSSGRKNCAYFLRGDAAMEKDHRWDRSLFPPMTDDYL
jgi:transglutaminase/protease-like cytokinesis protein 3